MPAFLARSTTSLFKRSVTFLLGIGRTAYVQKVFGDFGFGKDEVGIVGISEMPVALTIVKEMFKLG